MRESEVGSEHSPNNRHGKSSRRADWENGQRPVHDGSPPESREGCAAQGRWLAEVARQEHVAQPLHTQVSQVLHRICCVAGKGSRPGSQPAGQDRTGQDRTGQGKTRQDKTRLGTDERLKQQTTWLGIR